MWSVRRYFIFFFCFSLVVWHQETQISPYYYCCWCCCCCCCIIAIGVVKFRNSGLFEVSAKEKKEIWKCFMASAAKIAVNNHISCCCCIIEAQIIYYRIVCGWYISKAIPSKIAKKYLKPRQTFASLTVVVLALYFLRCRCYQTFAGVVVASNPPPLPQVWYFINIFCGFCCCCCYFSHICYSNQIIISLSILKRR